MREIPVAYLGSTVRLLAQLGCDTRACMRGLKLAEIDTTKVGERVDWDEVAMFFNRCARVLDTQQQEAVGALFAEQDPVLRLGARTVRSPRLLFHLMPMVSQAAFRHMTIRAHDLSDGRVYVHYDLPESYVPCPAYFRAVIGQYRTVTRHCDLPAARIESDAGPWHLYMWVTPPERSGASVLKDAASRVLDGLGKDLAKVVHWFYSQDVPGGGLDVTQIKNRHGLTWAEAHVALRLYDGKDPEAIAAELGMPPDEVGSHLRRVRVKTTEPRGTSSLN